MNFTTSGIRHLHGHPPGRKLRVWPAVRSASSDWSLARAFAIIATIILLYTVTCSVSKAKIRQWYGWSIIILSDIAFGAVTVFGNETPVHQRGRTTAVG